MGAPFSFSPTNDCTASIAVSVAVTIVAAAILIATVFAALVLAPFTFPPFPLAPLAAIALQLLKGFTAFMAPIVCLRAVVAKIRDRFMKTKFDIRYAPIATIPIVSLRSRRARKKQKCSQRGRRQCCLAEQQFP